MAIRTLKSRIEAAGENISEQLKVLADAIESIAWEPEKVAKYTQIAQKIRNADVHSVAGELRFDFTEGNIREIATILGVPAEDIADPIKFTRAMTDKVVTLSSSVTLKSGRINRLNAQVSLLNTAIDQLTIEKDNLTKICNRRKVANRVLAGILAVTILAGVLVPIFIYNRNNDNGNNSSDDQQHDFLVDGNAAYLAIIKALEKNGVEIGNIDIGDYINSIKDSDLYNGIANFLEQHGHEIPDDITLGDYVEGLYQVQPEVEAPPTLAETNLSAYLKIVNSLKVLGYEIDDTTDISDLIDALDDNVENVRDIETLEGLTSFLETSGFEVPEDMTIGEYVESLRGDYGSDSNVDIDFDLSETNQSAYYKIINLLKENDFDIDTDTDISDLINSLDDDENNTEALEVKEQIIKFLQDNEFEIDEDTDLGQFIEDLLPQVPTYEQGAQDAYQAVVDILEANGFDVQDILSPDGLLDIDVIEEELAPFVREAIVNAGIVNNISEEVDEWLNLYSDDLDNYMTLNIAIEALRNHIINNPEFNPDDVDSELGVLGGLVRDLVDAQETIAYQQEQIEALQSQVGVSDKTDGSSSNESENQTNTPVAGGAENEDDSTTTGGASQEENNDNFVGRK